MSQVTIFLDEETERAAREAAACANLSLSSWFAKFAERERSERERSKVRSEWGSFFAEINATKDEDGTSFPRLGEALTSQASEPPCNSH